MHQQAIFQEKLMFVIFFGLFSFKFLFIFTELKCVFSKIVSISNSIFSNILGMNNEQLERCFEQYILPGQDVNKQVGHRNVNNNYNSVNFFMLS